MLFFSQEKGAYPRYSGRDDIEFPSLEKLKLNFTEWQLTDSEGLFVCFAALGLTFSYLLFKVKLFVFKLREHGKLQELTLKGIKHEATIQAFRDGLA